MLQFPATKIAQFRHQNKSLRYGQAFHGFMKLDKCYQDKAFCDKLYNADDATAKTMIASRTDHNN